MKGLVYKFLLIFVSLIMLVITGCQKIKCEAYDLTHPCTNWQLFPQALDSYTLSLNDSVKIVLNRTLIKVSKEEKLWCHMCACHQSYVMTYESTSEFEVIRSGTYYNSYHDGSNIGAVGYDFNDIQLSISLTDENDFRSMTAYSMEREPEVDFVKRDSLVLNSVTYYYVREISIYNEESAFKKIWVVQGVGLIGIENDKGIWILE